MRINKSSRHQKIIGDFGEMMVCNWLSRSGFEVTVVDHTGIDVLAYHPRMKKRLGITVKSRTREGGKEGVSVNLFTEREDRKLLHRACKTFDCEPWVAVYVETPEAADLYLASLEHYDRRYRGRTGRAGKTWLMGAKDNERYLGDSDVKHIGFTFDLTHWWA